MRGRPAEADLGPVGDALSGKADEVRPVSFGQRHEAPGDWVVVQFAF